MPSALFENLALQGSKQLIPAFLYGTAWKKEKSADLVYQALNCGFTAVDTAAQPKHYQEDLVGDGIRRALSKGKVKRQDLYIQTKFTSISGQDMNHLPYNPASSIEEQVHTSIGSSLENLRSSAKTPDLNLNFVDCLVFHSPLPTLAQTLEAWRTAETYVPHKIRHLGISNVSLQTLSSLYEAVNIKPAVVQNRFYPDTLYDIHLRRLCARHSIIYQSFWTLTANPQLVYGTEVGLLSHQVGLSLQEALYCLVLGLGNIVILNGTKSEKHMIGDFEAVSKTRAWALKYPDDWDRLLAAFKKIVGDVDDPIE